MPIASLMDRPLALRIAALKAHKDKRVLSHDCWVPRSKDE